MRPTTYVAVGLYNIYYITKQINFQPNLESLETVVSKMETTTANGIRPTIIQCVVKPLALAMGI